MPIAAVWIGNICAPNSHLDLNGDTKTDSIDHKLMISKIDSFQFDRVVLSFFLSDLIPNGGPLNISSDPTSFLLRTNGEQANWFNRLWYFGHDSLSSTSKNYPTNIIPNFHAGYGDTIIDPKLINYLDGTSGTYWAGNKHYLGQAESIFDQQFYDTLAFSLRFNFPKPLWNWGTVNINSGFEWFKYQVGPLDFDSLSTRLQDSIHAFHIYHPTPYRLSNYYFFNDSINNKVNISVYPNPSETNITIKINNFTCDNMHELNLDFVDVTGRKINNLFRINGIDNLIGSTEIHLQNANGAIGFALCRIFYENQNIGMAKIIFSN